MTREPYDSVLYVHWLYWRLKVLESGYMDFQRLFENVMARDGDQFVRVKPHGKLGDKKCDGLFYGDGTVYQVYSPDCVERRQTLAKIKADLAGAVKEWGADLKEWVFVYNTRAGVSADVPALLKQQQREHPAVKISPLSDDDLWKIVAKLPVSARVELLGPPPAYVDFFPAIPTALIDMAEQLRDGRFIVVQDTMSPVNLKSVFEAIAPALPLGPPLFLRRRPLDLAWEVAAAHQAYLVEEALELSREHLPRFATFGFTHIALAVHLGYLLSDRVEVTPYQWHRERKSFQWDPAITDADLTCAVSGIPEVPVHDATDVVVRLSLSAPVTAAQTTPVVGDALVQIDIAVPHPDPVTWLVHPAQVTAFQRVFRETLARIRERVPHCRCIHLFAAVPMPCAVAAGQAINPRMNAPVQLYEFDFRRTPPYAPVLLLD